MVLGPTQNAHSVNCMDNWFTVIIGKSYAAVYYPTHDSFSQVCQLTMLIALRRDTHVLVITYKISW